jgi:hypothetical protein
MDGLAARTTGPEGELLAALPDTALFRTDPFDDGRFEGWQGDAGGAAWKPLRIDAGWDAQGFQDAQGRPYRGVGWYRFEVDLPRGETGARKVLLHAPAVVNEAWVWVNGSYAGHRPYGMPWFRPQELELDVTRLIRPGEKNRIVFRVLCNFDVWGANGIYERPFIYARKT